MTQMVVAGSSSSIVIPADHSAPTPAQTSNDDCLPDILRVKYVCCSCFAEREENEQPFLLCGKCKSVWYCNRECQMTAWATHKTVCGTSFFDTERVKRVSGIYTVEDKDKCYKAPKALIPEKHDKVCLFKEVDGIVRPMTQGEFQEKMGITYVTGALISQRNLLHMFGQCKFNIANCNYKLIPSDAIAIEKQGKMGFGVVALQDIPKDSVICGLGGIIEFREGLSFKLMRETLFSSNGAVDDTQTYVYSTKEYASIGVCINDGPRNCQFANKVSEGHEGYNERVKEPVIVATRDIKKGEPLYLDYGKGNLVKRGQYEFSEDAYQKALAICEENNNSKPTLNLDFIYILSTPLVLAQIFLRGDFPKQVKVKLYQDLKHNRELDSKKDPIKMLSGLNLIPEQKRRAFSQVLNKMSQQSLMLLCEYLEKYNSIPSVDDFVIMGKILDQVLVLMKGTLNGDLWITDYTRFSEKFSSEEHEKKRIAIEKKILPKVLDDGTNVPELPKEFLEFVSGVPDSFKPKINGFRQESFTQMLTERLSKDGRHVDIAII